MERAKLEEFNQWWIASKVDQDLALPYKRKIYPELVQLMKKRFIVALVGLRRTGKTTLMYQLIEYLLENKVDKTDIVFFSFDEISVDVEEVIKTYNEIHAKDFRQKTIYFFLDEIQKCRNWENELKKYYDLYPKIKFVISGSESLFIKKKTKETLAGRIFESQLNPFDFKEYLRINNVKDDEFRYETKIKPFFLKYIHLGGFPEAISLSEKEFKEYIKSLVVDKIVYKDIPKLFHIEDPEFLIVLLELIAKNPGMYIEYQSLAKQFGKDRRVIKSYLLYLQKSFLIQMLSNYRKGSTALRKIKRAYPTDPSFITLYKSSSADESLIGKVVETVVINNNKAEFFWKNSHEIDMVLDDVPVEVKYKEKILDADLKGVIAFMRKFKKKEAILLTKNDDKKIKVSEGEIMLIPVMRWLLK
jgi:predicted AAA+ superfamily ATPase